MAKQGWVEQHRMEQRWARRWVEQRFSASLSSSSERVLAPEVLCNNCPPAAKAAIKDSTKCGAEALLHPFS
jgi:hypothetical protein